MKRRGAVRLSDDIDRYLDALGLPSVSLLVSLHRRWAGIAGPLLAARAFPVRFRNGVLTIATCNHAWAQELQLCKVQLLAKVVAATGPDSPVSDLRFVAGNMPAATEEPVPADDDPPPGGAFEPEGLSSVGDAELRESLRAIAARLRPPDGR